MILMFTVPLFCGCQERYTAPLPPKPSLNTVAGMADYVRKAPAAKNVTAWQSDYKQGLIITTEHYKIYTTLMDPLMLQQVPGFVEAAYAGYQEQLPRPIRTTSKLDIYLFATRMQWEDFTKSFVGNAWPMYMKIKRGAYYLNGSCVAYNIGRTSTFSVLAHEGWHQFNSRHFRYRLPSWLDEGCAQLFEAYRYEKGKFIFDPGRNFNRLGSLKRTLSINSMIPLQRLITLNPGEVISHDTSDRSMVAFYAQSYALVRFLREHAYGKRLSDYHKMLLGSVEGTWPLPPDEARIASDRNIPISVGWNRYIATKIFGVYIKGDIQLIESEYINFCKKIVHPIREK